VTTSGVNEVALAPTPAPPTADRGSHPPRPVRALSQRSAYTSVRAPNRPAKNATFCAGTDRACTGPTGPASQLWVGRAGSASFADSSSRRINRAFSARNRVTRDRRPSSSRARSASAWASTITPGPGHAATA
jgi:hypothetical protein